jgi:glutathione S-transferase
MSEFILYGAPASLYTGKARAYLRKQGVDYRECSPGSPRYTQKILPAIGRFIIPVLETPEGEIVQDGTDIIDWFESRDLGAPSAYPSGARQRVVALLFELFGGEGLLRPAMHYRWNFDETNLEFITSEFGRLIAPGQPADVQRKLANSLAQRMREAARVFGVLPETTASIERHYEEFLGLFRAHLRTTPYLLGGVPSIGDYGLFAALHAHLARDPKPSLLMKQTAPEVFDWTERMNAREPGLAEYIGMQEAFLPDDAIPESVEALLRFVAADYLPEVLAFVAWIDAWLAERADLLEGSPAVPGDPAGRVLGSCPFVYRGQPISVGVFPYRLHMLQRVQDAFDALSGPERDSVLALFERTGLAALLQARARRRVERRAHLEVWGAARG